MKSQEATPPCASVAAALSTALATMRETLGRPLDRYEIFAAMRDLVGMRNWDSMPVAESVGAVRLMWTEADIAARATKYLLVTPEGRCYVEGVTPADPSQAAEYLAIRRRFLDAHPPVEPPLLGSPEALQAQAAYEALTDRIAEGLAGLIRKRYERTLLPEVSSVAEIARGFTGDGGHNGRRRQASSQT